MPVHSLTLIQSINQSPTHPPTHRLTRSRAHTHTHTVRSAITNRIESAPLKIKPTQPIPTQPSRARRRRLLLLLLLGYKLTVRMCMTDPDPHSNSLLPHVACHPHAPGPGPPGGVSHCTSEPFVRQSNQIPPGRASLSLLMDPTLVPMPPFDTRLPRASQGCWC